MYTKIRCMSFFSIVRQKMLDHCLITANNLKMCFTQCFNGTHARTRHFHSTVWIHTTHGTLNFIAEKLSPWPCLLLVDYKAEKCDWPNHVAKQQFRMDERQLTYNRSFFSLYHSLKCVLGWLRAWESKVINTLNSTPNIMGKNDLN